MAEYDEARWKKFCELQDKQISLSYFGNREDYWDHPQAIEARQQAEEISKQIEAMGEVVRPPSPPVKVRAPRKTFYTGCPKIGTDNQNRFVAFLARKAGFKSMLEAVAWALSVAPESLSSCYYNGADASLIITNLKSKAGVQ